MAIDKHATALELAKNAHIKRAPKDIVVRTEVQVFGGSLLTVTWCASDATTVNFDSYVFFDHTDRAHFFYNTGELARYFDTQRPNNLLLSALREISSVGGIPSIIAIIITVTICYIVGIKGLDKVPDVLGNALSVILGFYFGSKIARDSESISVPRAKRLLSRRSE